MYPCAVERESAVSTACCHAVSVGGEEQTARQGQHRVCQKVYPGCTCERKGAGKRRMDADREMDRCFYGGCTVSKGRSGTGGGMRQ